MTWTIETDRLLLRLMALEDLDAHARFPVDGDAMDVGCDGQLRRHAPKPTERERYERDGFGLLAVVERATGDMIGDCGPALQQTGHGAFVELGWHIRLDRQGNGFATEAAALAGTRRGLRWTSSRRSASSAGERADGRSRGRSDSGRGGDARGDGARVVVDGTWSVRDVDPLDHNVVDRAVLNRPRPSRWFRRCRSPSHLPEDRGR